MINYNPKDWFTFIFRVHKADTFRKLAPLIAAICVYTAIVVWFCIDYLELPPTNHLKDIFVMHSLLGFVISMLLVFRTNTAYDRWWEGRKMWGSLLNNSRNLALKLHSIIPLEAVSERRWHAVMISNYAVALKNHLRSEYNVNELYEHEAFNKELIHANRHLPNYLAREIFKKVDYMSRNGMLTQEQVLYINPEIMSFTEICGACERIKKTPIPYSYSAFLKKFIFFYVMTLPFTFAFSEGYYAVPTVAFIFYVLTSLELIAEEIEDPFGTDANDLPTDQISENVHKSVKEIFDLE